MGESGASVDPAMAIPATLDPAALFAIADSLPVMIGYAGTDGRYLFVNQPVVDWYERPRREIIGATFEELVGARFGTGEDSLKLALAGERQRFVTDFNHPPADALESRPTVSPTEAPTGW